MPKYFENVCVFHILDGLRDGLSHFSQPTRVALIYATDTNGPLFIYDPQDLLRGHEPRLQDFYIYSTAWKQGYVPETDVNMLDPEHFSDLQMAGIIPFGGRSKAVPYQVWFTEEHPDMCSIGPIRSWMEYGVRLFSQNFEYQSVLFVDTAGYLLQQCAMHAVRDHIVDERSSMGKLDTQLRVYPILDAVLGVSRTVEEGKAALGDMVFVEPAELFRLNFLALFPDLERPSLQNHKHVRKLLQCSERADRMLVSDGRYIVGIATGTPPDSSLVAEFREGYGFLKLNSLPICSFSDGSFRASNRRPNLVQLEEVLLESRMSLSLQHVLNRIVAGLVESAFAGQHGCTIVLDLRDGQHVLSGQHMEYALDLRQDRFLELAKDLIKVDGALHICRDMKLHGFGCLLDGHAVAGENLARGARYNSALRFTEENEGVIVVVVSADRPVSVIQGGVELTAKCHWSQLEGCPRPPQLIEWLRG